MLDAKPIGYKWSDEAEVLAHAATLVGHTALELANAVGDKKYAAEPKVNDKTGVGKIVERYFGIAQNNISEPDILNLGIEIKSIPLKNRKKTADMGVKEPTSITNIDYGKLLTESWKTAAVRRKMARILFIPYLHNYESRHKHAFRKGFGWSPPKEEGPILQADYQRVWDAADKALAHKVSESWSLILGARRKGEKGSEVPQPKGGPYALQRAWALRAAYTNLVVQQHHFGKPVVSILQTAAAKRAEKAQAKAKKLLNAPVELEDVHTLDQVMPYVEARFQKFLGWTLDEIAATIPDAEISEGKAGPATFVRQVLGIKAKGLIEEFEKLGIRVHTCTVLDGVLNEGVSFPGMKLKEFVEEDWDTSTFKDYVDRILFIPLHGPGQLRGGRVLGKAFIWSATEEELDGICKEWEMYQQETRDGKAVLTVPPGGIRAFSDYTSYTETQYMHVRHKATVDTPYDVDPLGNEVQPRCLWLNQAFVADLLKQNQADGIPSKVKP